jgi:CHAT domain-containing protein
MTIKPLLNSNSETDIVAAALGSSIVQRMPAAHLIHMATHGLLVNESLMSFGEQSVSVSWDMVPGALAVTPAMSVRELEERASHGYQEVDESLNRGFLTSGEILTINLQADLVVLSACDTGSSRVTEDNIVGLPSSLIASGAHSVIMTLWLFLTRRRRRSC